MGIIDGLPNLPKILVIVEGASDKVALETLASRTKRDLGGRLIVPIGGAHAIRRFLTAQIAADPTIRFAGLCDVAQEDYFKRALELTGLGTALDREAMQGLGFFVCVKDLEDELIRALGTATVEDVIEAQSEIRAFRSFQRQPAQSGVATDGQLRRFMGTHSGRKAQYARALVEALDLRRVPQPLTLVLDSPGISLGDAAVSR